MENRVYYGEYSLRHWIDLVLRKNIVLPDYQRYFVWNEKKVETLIETFKNKQFVPPVTIGAFKLGNSNENLLLDGQQRVTSILLAYLGLYPDAATYKSNLDSFANDNDDDEHGDESLFDNILEWNFKSLVQRGTSKEEILSNIQQGNYKHTNLNITDEFLDSNFLGFSYLVPQTSEEKTQQKYYSSVFRNINIQGEPLLPQESRASLYFLDQELVGLFDPDFAKKIVIKLVSSESKADFIRYLALLSQYHNDGDPSKVARGYKQKMEKLYEGYIFSAINGETSNIYGTFLNIFPDKEYKVYLEQLEKTLTEIGLLKKYNSIIELDAYLFGIIYHTLFKKKQIDTSKKEQLIAELDRKITQYKKDPSHLKSPNNLGQLRQRISDSIAIYRKYTNNESQ
ncbi:DUF262 domain-containing protein [uncultured Alteromonas sp.]|jgi:uncharacterized protein with ParB-like and HNH nuclease domain|uniref:DUF262 domain-containing protein n=1 Tax=uncultured Alteromonas sp. TaxID=179113 RepID=UPI0030ED0044|tara:strand:- start:804 stop:1994 length:1191 start_codon:yes stop_codon:yes gene_type:complete